MNLIGYLREKGIRHAFDTLVNYKINDAIENVLLCFYKNKPLKDIIIIESHNDFDSNGGALYDYLISNEYNKKYRIVWFLRNKCPKDLPENVEGYEYTGINLKRAMYHCTAKYIFSEHHVIPAVRDDQIAVFMRHGAGGLKNAANVMTLPHGFKYILGMSKSYAHIEKLERLFSDDDYKILYLGFPSHDSLFKNNSSELKKVTSQEFKKVLLWMPTFRKNVSGRNDSTLESPLGIPLINTMEEYEKLNLLLKDKNCLLVIKIHPMQDLECLKISDQSNIRVLTGPNVKELNVDNYRLMSCCDAMISDYSGAAYDFLQLDRPIAYVLSDMDQYKLGFVVDNIHELVAGKEIYSLTDFFDFINSVASNEDEFKEKREKIRDFVYNYHDGDNSSRLVSYLGITKN